MDNNKLTETQLRLFHTGNNYKSYEIMGAHVMPEGGVVFRVWAPEASSCSVIGCFNGWDNSKTPMKLISNGVWEVYVPEAAQLSPYRFAICVPGGVWHEKVDPYAFYSDIHNGASSKVYSLSGYNWGDKDWLSSRHDLTRKPVNIYEVHLSSWRRGDDSRILTYLELADQLIPYVKEMGYTHIELLPVMEHPLYDHEGYRTTGYFSASCRFGEPKEFMAFIDRCHQAGIGVILDWVCAYFPKDNHGLIEFDGSCCYEYAEPKLSDHDGWSSRIFDYSRGEVRSFLLSSAMLWLDVFHADGLRVDACSLMLYLDYGRAKGEWIPNKFGGNENLEAIDFLRTLNNRVSEYFPYALMIAEESASWPMVTKPTHIGGLGFTYKWNTVWTGDTTYYMKLDPVFRQYSHAKLTFSMMYTYSEQFILALSHNEVVNPKLSLIEKMPGYYPDKFAGVRAYLAYQMAHPGKLLTFMGTEIGQFIEWNCTQSLDWHLLSYDMHKKLQWYVKTLNLLYLRHREFWDNDADWGGFSWIDCGDYNGNTLSFRRIDNNQNEIICLFNFSPVNRPGYRLALPFGGEYREILCSNKDEFGGWGQHNPNPIYAQNIPCNGLQFSTQLELPPYGAIFLQRV